MSAVKDELHHLAERLPESATWKDVLYEAWFRTQVEEGLEDARQGRFATDDEIKAAFEKHGVHAKKMGG